LAGEDDPAAVRPSWLAPGAWTIIGLGVTLRLLRLAANRNLWLDELMLASDFLTRPLAGLAEPLSATGAPLGFLVVTRLAVDALGDHDWVLRLLPFIAGCAGLVLLYRVSLKLLAPRGVLFVLTILAVVEPALYYSGEFKQYSVDLAATLAILLATLRAQRPEKFAAGFLALGIIGAASVWFSFPAVFVLAGAGVILFAPQLLAGRWRAGVALLAVAAAWIGSFVAIYLLTLRDLIGNDFLQQSWSGNFMPVSPTTMASWQLRTLYDSFGYPLGLPQPGAALLAAMLGTVDLARRRPQALGLILLPFAFGMAASAFNKFPFGGRQILFVVPLLALLVAAGLDVLLREPQPLPRLAGILLACILIAPPAVKSMRTALGPQGREEVGPVLRHVATQWQSGDTLYLYWGAGLGYARYAPRVGMPAGVIPIVGVKRQGDWFAYYEDIAKLAGRERVWVVFSHVLGSADASEERMIVAALDHVGQRVEAVRELGAAAYLYDLRDSKAAGHPTSGSISHSPWQAKTSALDATRMRKPGASVLIARWLTIPTS